MAFWSKDKAKESDKDADPQALVARKEYDKAIKAYRAQLLGRSGDYALNHKIADVLCLAGRTKESIADYQIAAEGYQREGYFIKAIAILKKLQKLDPGNKAIDKKLAALSESASSTPSASIPSTSSMGGEDELSLDMEMFDDEAPERPASIPVAASEPEAEEVGTGVPATPLFSELRPEELVEVVGMLRHHAFAQGSVLVKEGDPGDSLFVLSEGRVEVATKGPKGAPVVLASLGEGDFFGEVSLLTGKPRTATITAVDDTEVLELTREDLASIEQRFPRIREVIKEFYDRRVASTVEAMIQAARGKKSGPSRR